MHRLEKGSDHRKSSATTMSSQIYPHRRTAADNFLYSENDKSDYDWLVTPPGSPSKSSMNQLDNLDANPMALNSTNQTNGLKRPSSSGSSRSTNRHTTPATRSTTPTSRATSTASRVTLTSSSTTSSRSTTLAKRPSSSGTSRATSTSARATLTSSSTTSSTTLAGRPSSSGTSRATSTAATSRPSTPTRRPSSSGTSHANLTTARVTTLTAQQTTGIATSTRSNNRPMTATNTKPLSRPTTPTHRPPTSTGSSTVLKGKPTKPVCKPAASPTLRSRPWEPYEMPGFSLDAPPNLRTTLPDRPQTASSRRTIVFGTSTSRSASIERTVSRRQSCSPSRNRAPIGNVDANGASSMLRGGRPKTSNDDGSLISPIAKGNQKVERVENVRKLSRGGDGVSSTGKSSSGSDGFGRNISKNSFDMALRHMDIKGESMKGNFRPKMTKVPVASLYSVIRSSGTRRKRPVSSSGSSESSVSILCLDGSEDNLSDISYS